MPTAFAPDLWIADGPVVTGLGGFRFATRMAVIRLSGGGLFLWSPTAVTPDLLGAVAALGPVAHIVGPNQLHHLALADWAAAFPEARLHGTAALIAKRPDLRFEAPLGDAPDPAWAADLDQVLLHGNRITDEAVFLHRPSRTAIFTDLIQRGPGHDRGWRALVARADLKVCAAPHVPRIYRLAPADRAAQAAAAARILAWAPERALMAHGAPVTSGATQVLAEALSPIL